MRASTCYNRGAFDNICFHAYMYIAFKVKTPIDLRGRAIDGYSIYPGDGQKIIKIGKLGPGRQASGWRVLENDAPAHFTFAGTFTDAGEDNVYWLFNSILADGSDQFAADETGKIPGTEYTQIYVALLDFSAADFFFNTNIQCGRLVAKHLEFLP